MAAECKTKFAININSKCQDKQVKKSMKIIRENENWLYNINLNQRHNLTAFIVMLINYMGQINIML